MLYAAIIICFKHTYHVLVKQIDVRFMKIIYRCKYSPQILRYYRRAPIKFNHIMLLWLKKKTKIVDKGRGITLISRTCTRLYACAQYIML